MDLFYVNKVSISIGEKFLIIKLPFFSFLHRLIGFIKIIQIKAKPKNPVNPVNSVKKI